MKVYLDDERNPKTNNNWIIKRSYKDAVKYVKKYGCPKIISFDHDLGIAESGLDFVKWLIEYDLDNPGFIPKDFHYNVHSANPVGARNIESLLGNYLKRRG